MNNDKAGAYYAGSVGTIEKEYAAAQTGCVMIDASAWGRLTFTGQDRVDFLHRMSTNDLLKLASRAGGRDGVHDPDRAHRRSDGGVRARRRCVDADFARESVARGAVAAQIHLLQRRCADQRRDRTRRA